MVGHHRPLAYYAIGTYAAARQRRPQVAMWKHLVARADVVAAEGDEVRMECIRLLGVPPEKVVMTPNGRDPEVFRPRAGPDRSPLTITFVGALTEGKGPDRFVEVIAALRGRGLDLRARIVGNGPLAPSLVEPAGAAGIELLGSRPDIPDLLARSDIMVFPSRPTGEGMPGVLIEAGLTGIPVVATDVPGVRTVIADGETGVIVPHDDLPAMITATERGPATVCRALQSRLGGRPVAEPSATLAGPEHRPGLRPGQITRAKEPECLSAAWWHARVRRHGPPLRRWSGAGAAWPEG
jgi:glycosyltransferase involved in cell wall biosynthesis